MSREKQEHTFQLEDNQGEIHEYSIGQKHPPKGGEAGMSGLEIISRISASAREPISKLVDSGVGKAMEGVDVEADSIEGAQEEFEKKGGFASMDVGGVISSLLDAFQQLDLEVISGEILRYTFRDGQSLAHEDNFNKAYAGNYQEMAWAVWEVASHNNFLFSLLSRIKGQED